MQSRNYCFTINNYTLNEIDFLENKLNYSYLIYGYEKGENGTEHLQGYIEFSSCKRFNTLKRELPRAHLEPRRGSQKQAIEYCKKEGEWLEFGCKKEQGRRTDLQGLMQAIKEETPHLQIMEEQPEVYSRNIRFVDRYQALMDKEQTKAFRQVETHVIWNEQGGIGKSRKAREEDPDIFEVNPEDAFPFDGYAGEKTILLEDFEGGGIKYKHLLKILDGYQLRVNVKGGHRYARWNKVFITANKHPKEWYQVGLTQPLARRLTNIEHFTPEAQVQCVSSSGVILGPATEVLEDNILDI